MKSDPARLDRRALMASLAAAPGVADLALTTRAQATATETAPSLLAVLSELVLPRTASPGATEAGVHQWTAFAIAHGVDGAPKDLVEKVEAELDAAAAPVRFNALPLPEKARLLARLDADSMGFAPRIKSDWPRLKALIVWAYYTSEPGGSVELSYLPVPGHFDGDVEDKGQADISNNWIGLAFG